MALESKPLFHPEVLRQQVRAFTLPERVEDCQPKLQEWDRLIASGRADNFKETALLPDFLTDIFCGLLGYTGPVGPADTHSSHNSHNSHFTGTSPAESPDTFTFSRERHVEVDGEFADAVLGRFQKRNEQFIAVLEGKGARDPLDRPFAGRRMSAVDQAYRYAINLPCDWIIVTSMRETRLYYKGAHQQTYERFETVRLAADEALLKRFVFLLGAERVVPAHGECHLYELLRASETVGRALTNQFYALYADIRQRVLARLCHENATIAPPEILRCTQKLLDRVLFCAFCEDRGLLPAESLKHAFEQRNPYNPQPVWLNFRGLFRAIDEGNAGLNIPAYNGGLFAPDPSLDGLQVPDEVCAHFKDLGDYDYRPAREVAEGDEDTEVLRFIKEFVQDLPIPRPTPQQRQTADISVRRLIEIASRQHQTQRTLLDWLRVEYAIEKPSNKLLAATALDSDTWVGEVKRIRGKKLPLTAAGVHALRNEYTRTIEPARALAAETLKLERTLSDLVNQAYALTPAEIDLMWKTAPPRMPVPWPAT